MISFVRSVLLFVACACTGSEPSHPPEVTADKAEPARHESAPQPTLDVPRLATTTGTLEPVTATTIKLSGVSGEVAAQRSAIPERGAALLAIDRAVAIHTVLQSFAEVRRAGVSDLGLLVMAGNERRMVVMDGRIPSTEVALTVAVIYAGADLTLGGKPIAIDSLQSMLARERPSRVVIDFDPNLTMQRLAEVIAASGGHAFVGKSTLPTLTRSAPSP